MCISGYMCAKEKTREERNNMKSELCEVSVWGCSEVPMFETCTSPHSRVGIEMFNPGLDCIPPEGT